MRRSLVRPSTRAFAREARRTAGYSVIDWLHGYAYARWIYLYIGLGSGTHPLARLFAPAGRVIGRLLPRPREGSQRHTFADGYHGKVVPLEAATHLVTVNEDVTLTDLETTIPYALARDIVLHDPDHIVAIECPCRSVRSNPCLPLDVCLIVGEPFASFTVEHHPRRSRRITPEEAVGILRAEDNRGHVHHAFFKDAMLGRFYAICNCCSCCCEAMRAWSHGTPMLTSSGYVARVDSDLCKGCGVCARHCQFHALSLSDKRLLVDRDGCMGCGVCVSSCKQGALALEREPSRGEPLEIRELIACAAAGGGS
jgi:ferredoxin